MSRPKNSKNRPTYGLVKLSVLCEILNSETNIPVSLKFLDSLAMIHPGLKFNELPTHSKPEKPVTVSDSIEYKEI